MSTPTTEKIPRPEDAPPAHPVHKDRLTYCRKCQGSGNNHSVPRRVAICGHCIGTGKVSTDSAGAPIVWFRGKWVKR